MKPDFDFFLNFFFAFWYALKSMDGFMHRFLLLTFFLLTGCFQAYNSDDDLRAVPVTNNPHVVPNYGGGLPGMGGGAPY